MIPDPTDTPRVEAVADGVYVRLAVDNVSWIDLGDAAIAVDAAEEPHLEGEIFAAIEDTVGDSPVTHMLNTHTHYDHVALNDAFTRRWNTEIVNQDATPMGPEGRWLQGARRKALMLPCPGCHTDEDCLVWVPDQRVLFVGDIFGWGLIPLIVSLRTETAQLLIDTYTRLIEFDAGTIVPGHGPLCTSDHLQRWIEYFQWIQGQVRRAVDAGKSDEQIADQLPPPEDMASWWRFAQWKHEDTRTKVISATRRGRLD